MKVVSIGLEKAAPHIAKKALSVVVMMQYEGGNKLLEKELIPMVYNWLEQNENTTR